MDLRDGAEALTLPATQLDTRPDKERMMALVLDALKLSVDGHTYPGGPSAMLSDLLASFGIPIGRERIKQLAARGRRLHTSAIGERSGPS